MKKRMFVLAAVLAGGAALADTPRLLEPVPLQVTTKHMYINLATGERRIDDMGARYGGEIWNNGATGLDDPACGNYFYSPYQGGAGDGWGSEYIDWGSIDNGTVMDGFRIWYYSPDMPWDPNLGYVPGLNCHIWFYIDYWAWGGGPAAPIQEIVLYDLPADPAYSWLITVDLEGGNEITFNGFDDFCLDDKAEFGWGMSWDMPNDGLPDQGQIGPIFAMPPAFSTDPGSDLCDDVDTGCTLGTATGVQDIMDLYDAAPMNGYRSTWWWGGWDTGWPCSMNIILYGPGGNDCPPDFNGDGVLNSQDFVAFLNAFVAGDPSADYNGDGNINSQDFVAFLNDFVAGC